MLKKFRARFSSAHVLAGLALFVALGGSAYALKKNSVGTKQIKNNAVKEAKLANGAVTTPKLADNAATGAKVDEASLGKVPSAASADKATTADSASTATSATLAADSDLFTGLNRLQVRSFVDGVTDDTSQGLDDSLYEQVMTQPMTVPTGGADLIVQASVELDNESGGQAGAQCELRSDLVTISQTYTITMTDGHNYVMSLTGLADNLPPTAAGDPENVGVFCQGSIGDNDIMFLAGDLVVERVPSAG